MTNPIWTWAVEHRHSAHRLNKAFGGPHSKDVGPCWSFSRYGRTETMLPDGRLVRIGGEYEDWYDPDFYIYNDVIVTDAEGRTEIFGYPDKVFPPTDFHTANLVDDRIFIMGNLSYPFVRTGTMQVLVLDTISYRIDRFQTTGEAPPWIHKHSSELVENGRAILVRGGLICGSQWPALVENIDDWRLGLNTGRWERLTRRPWTRFTFVRTDGMPNHLYWLGRLLKDRARGKSESKSGFRAEFLRDLGADPRLDLLETLYAPDIPHSKIPEIADEYRVHRLCVEGVTVRYVEGSDDIKVTVEGVLPDQTVEATRLDLLTKLEAIENASIDCITVTV
ncbi:hypothetical protein EN828_21470 [Mesorhizobium sp. M2D.F.Ca.ET.185.01.1.1]|uniref:hypothetical protein n=2 Tax=Mesorhizobium TaxID=68287 RepID=UPI000FCA8160|nr:MULTISPECIES: hypothetical protein [unclassified Mesorhizobium]TGP78143.1 hypothetical protein EN870_17755 [bacterium M00.F.Ca.ET.227.01.1.1]TGP88265.1 hypothetical protein EN864_22080 [bacterium M00.F.Ca.ET.221.01.1.1]TGP93478.1 hypothetical protein EN865_17950 [bacterium M00.F.Ca.ET.222.01.1.1]TGU12948.1 hypothetical protein EN806_16410 [bacterium M00.F.Ca.ET.163.01.1.1]TGU31434.1 hypothetical protein EN799_29020 [bacterium M00.F.Ca.ET.156.01.1.1]TGU45453.1 hypothetical protein EN789_191